MNFGDFKEIFFMAIFFFQKRDFVTEYSFPKKNHKMVKICPQHKKKNKKKQKNYETICP